ncbi:DUF1564 family protein [Leptospira alstonii]|uniref:DUF1564 family protein n=1 Tax=Leptospira alstonii TaxID=28452 RepID=UPI000774DD6D
MGINKDSIISSLKSPKITCSFLIPFKLLQQLPISERKKIGKNLRLLLNNHSTNLKVGKRLNSQALTIKYQKKGNSLVKFNARIHPEDWAELSILAATHGVSRCLLYCLLIQLQLSKLSKRYLKIRKDVQKIESYSFIWSFNLSTKVIRRILYE